MAQRWRWRFEVKSWMVSMTHIVNGEVEQTFIRRVSSKMHLEVEDGLPSQPDRYVVSMTRDKTAWNVKGAVKEPRKVWSDEGVPSVEYVETGRMKRIERSMDDSELMDWLARRLNAKTAAYALMRLKGIVS